MLVRLQRGRSPRALLVGTGNGAATVKNGFLEKLNREYSVAQQSHSYLHTPMNLRQISKQNLYVNVHSSAVLKSQIAQMSTYR